MGFIYRFIYAVLFCAVLPFVAAEAHDVTFNRLSTEDGLSQVSVNDVYVDENGLVWIGTREGLNRYDGNGIKVFRMEKDNPYSLFSNQVLKVTGDRKGHLYLLCVDGLARFDMQTGRFSVVYRGQVSAVLYHGGLYVGCDERLFRYDEDETILLDVLTIPATIIIRLLFPSYRSLSNADAEMVSEYRKTHESAGAILLIAASSDAEGMEIRKAMLEELEKAEKDREICILTNGENSRFLEENGFRKVAERNIKARKRSFIRMLYSRGIEPLESAPTLQGPQHYQWV